MNRMFTGWQDTGLDAHNLSQSHFETTEGEIRNNNNKKIFWNTL